MARNGPEVKWFLPGMPHLPGDVTQEASPQPTDTATHHRGALRAHRDGPCGAIAKSARRHEHILVIIDYATRYPEAIPLRKATAKAIAQELFLLSSRVGIPAEILTDQGTPFMSRLMADPLSAAEGEAVEDHGLPPPSGRAGWTFQPDSEADVEMGGG